MSDLNYSLKMVKETKVKLLNEIYSDLEKMDVISLDWVDVNNEVEVIDYLDRNAVLKYLIQLQRKSK